MSSNVLPSTSNGRSLSPELVMGGATMLPIVGIVDVAVGGEEVVRDADREGLLEMEGAVVIVRRVVREIAEVTEARERVLLAMLERVVLDASGALVDAASERKTSPKTMVANEKYIILKWVRRKGRHDQRDSNLLMSDKRETRSGGTSKTVKGTKSKPTFRSRAVDYISFIRETSA
jgi:hypothetical protein